MKLSKEATLILAIILSLVACSIVSGNDYEDELIDTHNKCSEFPQLQDCRNYDPTEYRRYMDKKNGS